MRKRVMAVAIGLLVVATACGGGSQTAQPSSPAASSETKTEATSASVDNPTETKRSKEVKSYRDTVKLSIDDIQSFWAETMPRVFGKPYVKIPDDKLFAVTPGKTYPSCEGPTGTSEYKSIRKNAMYCTKGYVAWDDVEFMPGLYTNFGEYAVAMLFAHEWGHAIQHQIGIFFKYPVLFAEQQADCFSGAWTKHSLENKKTTGFNGSPADLQAALAGMFSIRDPLGTDQKKEDNAHGTGFDRVNAFSIGYEQGAEGCADFEKNQPKTVNITFSDEQEKASKGNLPLEDAIRIATQDLNAYWSSLIKQAGFTFKPVTNTVRFSKDTAMPKCGGKQYTDKEALNKIFFCVEDNYVAWDDNMMKDVSQGIGDFGVATLLARQWTVSVQSQDGQSKSQIESKQGHLQQSCFTGAWTRAVLDGDKHNLSNGQPSLSLSPGDLDEAIQAFLGFSESPNDKGDTDTGSAFEQAQAYRNGFFQGAADCANYSLSSGTSTGSTTTTTSRATTTTARPSTTTR